MPSVNDKQALDLLEVTGAPTRAIAHELNGRPSVSRTWISSKRAYDPSKNRSKFLRANFSSPRRRKNKGQSVYERSTG